MYIHFKIVECFGKKDEYSKIRVRVSRISDLLDDYHRDLFGKKLAEELKQPEFINKLNDAIKVEKQRLARISSEANKQREFKVEDFDAYFKWH